MKARIDGLTILVVDDTESIRKMMHVNLIQRGYAVIAVAGGREALKHLTPDSEPLPDMVLLDQSMPDMDGLTTFDEIKVLCPDLPVIMVTAHDSVPLAVEFMRRGGDMFVPKPINFDILDVIIQQAIRGARHRVARRMADVARVAAEKASAAKSRFLQNITHELRTPLTSVLGYTEQAEDALHDGNMEAISYCLSHIVDSAEQQVKLIDDLLELTHTIVLDVTRCSMSGIVRDIVKQMRPAALNRRLTISLREQVTTPPQIRCDNQRIGQAIVKVLDNAIVFATEGTDIAITLAGDDGGGAVLTVANQGIGIPSDELVSIFDPGTQSSLTDTGAGGTGLGLALCRNIFEAHGGGIRAENSTSGGVVFIITLPA